VWLTSVAAQTYHGKGLAAIMWHSPLAYDLSPKGLATGEALAK